MAPSSGSTAKAAEGRDRLLQALESRSGFFDPAATFTERLLGQVAMHSAHISGLCGDSEEHGGATRRGNSGIQEQSANQKHADLSDCKSIGTFV